MRVRELHGSGILQGGRSLPARRGDWKGFGSDQYLQVLVLESVGGIQDNETQAIIQHFIANDQEHHRGDGFASNGISANMDDKLRLY